MTQDLTRHDTDRHGTTEAASISALHVTSSKVSLQTCDVRKASTFHNSCLATSLHLVSNHSVRDLPVASNLPSCSGIEALTKLPAKYLPKDSDSLHARHVCTMYRTELEGCSMAKHTRSSAQACRAISLQSRIVEGLTDS